MERKLKENLLIEKINKYKNIIIAKHLFPDWDAQGSAFGLKYIIESNFKDKNIFIVGTDIENTNNIFNADLPINIINEALLITVDTANKERIDFQLIENAKEIFKIDHHLNIDKYAHNELVIENASSCTEVITLWAMENNLIISKDAGYFLYKGLITDSGRFLYKSTSENTFEAAKCLLKTGIEINKIYDYLYLRNFNEAKLYNSFFNKIKINVQNNIAYILFEKDELLNIEEEKIKSALSVMSGIIEFKIWMLIYEKDGIYKVSLRSRDFNVNSVAVKYNGGGHILASGCKLENLEKLSFLVHDLEKLIEEN